jgi:selenocysteine lyase/cysteine desulfurase
MSLSRRDWLVGTGQLLAAGAFAPELAMPSLRAAGARGARSPLGSARDEFPLAKTKVYLNNASVHPIGVTTHRAATEYLGRRLNGPRSGQHYSTTPDQVKASFAALVNANASEISFVTSTEVGENLVVNGMGLAHTPGNIVTDALHFEGSLYMYRSLKDQGVDVRIAMPREGRIHVEDLAAFVDSNTKLVAVSAVSFLNGFQHDLKAVADLAHAHGAHLYADIIQGAGCIPIDLHAANVDFAACATYKWLMGDFGLGFFYVRDDLQGSVIKRTMYGFEQFANFDYHIFPHQPAADQPFGWTLHSGAAAMFEIGTIAYAPMAALAYSLGWIQQLGVSDIYAHRVALARRLQQEMPRLGYPSLTPVDRPSGIVSFVVSDEAATNERLAKGNIEVKVDQHLMRVSPALYNNDADIDALLNALN